MLGLEQEGRTHLGHRQQRRFCHCLGCQVQEGELDAEQHGPESCQCGGLGSREGKKSPLDYDHLTVSNIH